MWVQHVFGSVVCGFSTFLVVRYFIVKCGFSARLITVLCVFGSVICGLSPFLVV